MFLLSQFTFAEIRRDFFAYSLSVYTLNLPQCRSRGIASSILATPAQITRRNPRQDLKVYRLSSVGTDSLKSPSPHPSSTPDVTGLVENLYVSNITVEWVVLVPCILGISGSSLKLQTSYPDRTSLLLSPFLSGKLQNSMTRLKSSDDNFFSTYFQLII